MPRQPVLQSFNNLTEIKIPPAEAIAGIEAGTWEFNVMVNNQRVKVIVATRLGVKYLKTENDAEEPNNLLSLPECP